MLGAFKARVAPFNVNYRYVAEELQYLLTDSGARRSSTTPRSRRRSPRSAPSCPTLERALQVADESGNDLLAGRRLVRGRARRAPRRTRLPVDRRRPTTSTSSTPAARPACRRACCGARPTSSSAALGGRRNDGAPHRVDSTSIVEARRHGGRAARDARAAVHARRRPLDRVPRLHRRQHRRHPGRRPSASTPPTSGRSSSARRSTFLLIVGDAFAPPAARRARPRHVRPVARSPCCSRAARRSPRRSRSEFLAHLPDAHRSSTASARRRAGGQMHAA